jgi:hypothetical protein
VFEEIQLRKLVTLAKPTGYPSVQPSAAPNDTTPTWVQRPSLSWTASAPPLSPCNTRHIYRNVTLLVKVTIVTLKPGNLNKTLLKKMCITLQTDFGPIHMLTMDSNTLCTTDIEQWKVVTTGVVCVVTANFVLWTTRSELLKNI